LDFEDVEALRQASPAWRLLRADNAPLVLTFLGRVFVEENVRAISRAELVSRLDDELYALNDRLGAGTFPKAPQAYLDDWSAPERGWLRKYYPPGQDEPHYDVTPAVERASSWVAGLRERSFVGTESRLNTALELLRQMAFGTESDPDVRLVELHRRRADLDAEIARVAAGDVQVMDPSAQRDRYQQFAATATELLADFREVEANFRALDRDLRERITGWAGSKGELLDDVLGSRSSIAGSDQGRSFDAFYGFLLSHQRREEFAELLRQVHALDAIGAVEPRMRTIHHAWLDAGERTQTTVRMLSEQLRRFLDDQVWLENRRVMDILRSIEAGALRLRDRPAAGLTTQIDAAAPTVALPMERPLYQPGAPMALDSADVGGGDDDFDSSLLFEQVYVDPARLVGAVRRALRAAAQIDLAQLLRDQPLEQGLAELVTYLSLTDPGFAVVFDEEVTEQICWPDAEAVGRERVATVPRVTFARAQTAARAQTGTPARGGRP
jgi:hypothetical protein